MGWLFGFESFRSLFSDFFQFECSLDSLLVVFDCWFCFKVFYLWGLDNKYDSYYKSKLCKFNRFLKTKKSEINSRPILMGRLTGFEPATSWVTVKRSNQLSYSRHGYWNTKKTWTDSIVFIFYAISRKIIQ